MRSLAQKTACQQEPCVARSFSDGRGLLALAPVTTTYSIYLSLVVELARDFGEIVRFCVMVFIIYPHQGPNGLASRLFEQDTRVV